MRPNFGNTSISIITSPEETFLRDDLSSSSIICVGIRYGLEFLQQHGKRFRAKRQIVLGAHSNG